MGRELIPSDDGISPRLHEDDGRVGGHAPKNRKEFVGSMAVKIDEEKREAAVNVLVEYFEEQGRLSASRSPADERVLYRHNRKYERRTFAAQERLAVAEV